MDPKPPFFLSVSSEKFTRPEVLTFKAAIAKADGRLLELRKLTHDGKKLYITARHIEKGDEVLKENITIKEWSSSSGLVVIGVYMEEQPSKIIPVGYQDWVIKGNMADITYNVHESFTPTGEHERLAKEKWRSDSKAFNVDRKYQRQDIGTLMMAVSGIVLSAVGVKKFSTDTLLGPTRKVFQRFGVKPENFVGDRKLVSLPIKRLSESSRLDDIISEFV